MSSREMIGTYQGTGRGYGFFLPGDGGADWFVPPHRDGGAWDGDVVTAASISSDSPRAGNRTHSGAAPLPNKASGFAGGPGERTVCQVTAILERANREVTGTVRKQGREFWLEPDNKRLPMILLQTKKGRIGSGDKIAAHILTYGGRSQPPMGRPVEHFGRSGTRQAAVEAILYRYDIGQFFPPDVQAEAEREPEEVQPDALVSRRDLRDQLIITIDGASAKDLDDAVSLTKDAQGRWVLGVHIADVSHYVTAGSALDREAWERGTSVYFADRVIPMLPPQLSNGICSLNPKVDRLTLSCVMTLTADGQEAEHEIFKSVIRTAERMNYSDCNALLAGEDPELQEKYAHILPMLRDMAALAAKLERKRRLRGSLELESMEPVILCDAHGAPVGMELREPGRAEKLIEEFMLCANETVAKHLHGLDRPAVYRVHEKPTADKAERLRAMLSPFGLDVKSADHFSLQKVLDAVRGKPEAAAVNAMVLRSMMKARYDGENLGHFGLAAEYYCHFTSPIRRYPDLMVHRVLSALLAGDLHGRTEGNLRGAVGKAAEQSSRRELAAQSAEREIEKCYMAEFMQARIGEAFPGAVSGVTRLGVYVTLPFGAEGMVAVERLNDYDFDYDEARMTLTGRRGTVFSLGMPLEVVCIAADPGSGQIDFALSGGPAPAPARRREERKIPQKPKKKSYKAPKWKRR